MFFSEKNIKRDLQITLKISHPQYIKAVVFSQNNLDLNFFVELKPKNERFLQIL